MKTSEQERAIRKVFECQFEYGAYAKCGCLVGLCVDMGDKETGKAVGSWIAQGLHIERFPRTELKERLKKGIGCSCEESKPESNQPRIEGL